MALDVADLDLRNRRAKVRRKGGAVDVIVWRTATARLLPRLLDGRRVGPVFLTGRRARVQLPPGDLDPGSGRAPLSYRRAAELFEATAAKLADERNAVEKAHQDPEVVERAARRARKAREILNAC
jgi:hypothetical protein